ncbi:MAG: MBL fold metallo-hydrolase [Polaromonas sp.]|uniref:MBL fold metallo-hydrolase n=1 Tax=Polaromonas sp. TaxID=1869339 RepID=UPI002734C93F|nr:MBL fold metallo-hydrolase [Polaromonas sp.]MDP3799405.1 MBL fold metallo-hydrolase [Polaromonas sp.]
MYLIPIPAFTDNYLRSLHDGKRALVVDPGEAGPEPRTLEQHALPLEPILVTHHHADHTGGVDALRDVTGARIPGTGAEYLPEHNPRSASIDRELLANPFLRTRQATIMATARRFDAPAHDDTTLFATRH